MDLSELKGYLDNATRHLVDAQSVCYQCSIRIQQQIQVLSQWQDVVTRINFTCDCMVEQCQFLYRDILHVGIEQNLIQRQWGDDVLSGLRDQMRLWQGRIENQMRQLETTRNALAASSPSIEANKDGGKDVAETYVLADYLTRDNMNLLRNKIEEVPNIEKHINNIRVQYNELNKKVKERLIDSRLKDLQKMVSNEFDIGNKDLKALLETYPRDLSVVEDDLGSILVSLTRHFDRCKMLYRKVETSIGDQAAANDPAVDDTVDYVELCKIVAKDNDELPSIVNTMYEIIEDVETVLFKSSKLLKEKKTSRDLVKNKMTKILNDLMKYNEYLIIFQDISQLISNFKESCQQDIITIQELFEFYEQFQKSYQNLLQEVDRRRIMATRMGQVLKNCEKQLKDLEFEDIAERHHFLEQNGNYLPGNIWPNEIDDFTPLYSMTYSIKRF